MMSATLFAFAPLGLIPCFSTKATQIARADITRTSPRRENRPWALDNKHCFTHLDLKPTCRTTCIRVTERRECQH